MEGGRAIAWFFHYWGEINNRNICSNEISAREDAMRKACSLMRDQLAGLSAINLT
jgi:hypothetical protein